MRLLGPVNSLPRRRNLFYALLWCLSLIQNAFAPFSAHPAGMPDGLFFLVKGIYTGFFWSLAWLTHLWLNDWLNAQPKPTINPNRFRFLRVWFGLPLIVAVLIGIRYLIEQVLFTALFGFGNYDADGLTLEFYVTDNLYTFWPALVTGGVLKLLEDRIVLQRERTQLVNQRTAMELAYLKAQVNPHFLFNSLNSLSSLIGEDPARAEQFVDRLASVYRYLLQTNQTAPDVVSGTGRAGTDLATVEAELAFIRSYYFLLQTRYGDGFGLRIEMDAAYSTYRLPATSLQLLVENALKHNVVSMSKPLLVEILSGPDNNLLVRNNRQPRKTRVLSNQVGLSTIKAKYRLLAEFGSVNGEVVVAETAESFTVTLPLFEPHQRD